MSCPCQSEQDFENCCEPIIVGKIQPDTALQLMKARYTAYTHGNMDFIEETHHPQKRKEFDRKASQEWADQVDWVGLKILNTEGGQASDEEGIVEFTAQFKTNQGLKDHNEISQFSKHKGKWYFVTGRNPQAQTLVREGPKVGRNDPCPCGSQKKYKKCCGLN